MGLSSSTQNKRQIFILSGQSNMAGRGGVKNHHWDHKVPDDCKPDPTAIHRLTANLTWETAQEPLHADIDKNKTCGVGPGMSFANAVKDYNAGVIGLVPCAIGGTAIKKWAKGEKLYEDMVRRARSAGGEIKALLWYQGESDTSSKTSAQSYKSNMENLIRNIRADLGLPALPVIQVAIASGEGKYTEVVREAQKAIDLPNVVCVDVKGLELKDDHLHLTTTAQVQLGHMLADAYLARFG
ncbi:putative sialate O-acetylesterase domain, SGNH hydrolase superfamily [Helianthus debilis subsp. tardiflorus]